MVFITFRGHGWLSYLLMMVMLCTVGSMTGVDLGMPDHPGVAFAIRFAVIGVLVHGAVGWWFNSVRTPRGLVWHDAHTAGGIPMQWVGLVHVGLAVPVAALDVGTSTSAWLGWTVGLSPLILLILAWLALTWVNGRRRGRPTPTGAPEQRTAPAGPAKATTVGRGGDVSAAERRANDRRAIATVHGWRYRRSSSQPTCWWRPRYGRAAKHLTASNVVEGELRGFRFTVFDATAPDLPTARPMRQQMRTICVVHLPTARPRVVVFPRGSATDVLQTPPWQPLVRLHPADVNGIDAAGEDGSFVTPDQLAFTASHRLTGWRIEGSDLVLVAPAGTVLAPDAVVATVEHLIDLAERFDTPSRPWTPPRQQGGRASSLEP